MQYTISINQLALAETTLDLNDAAILQFIYFLCSSVNPKIEKQRLTRESVVWTWISYQALMRELPLLRIKSGGALTPRFQRLCAHRFIEVYRHTNQRLYVRLLPRVDELFTKLNGSVHETEQLAVHETERTLILDTYSHTKDSRNVGAQQRYHELVEHVRQVQGLKAWASKSRQFQAAKQILSSGYTVEEAKQAADRMAADTYWQSRSFDVGRLAHHIHKYSKAPDSTFIDLGESGF